MADTKVSALTAATTPLDGTELVPIVQSGASKKVALSNVTIAASQVTGTALVRADLSKFDNQTTSVIDNINRQRVVGLTLGNTSGTAYFAFFTPTVNLTVSQIAMSSGNTNSASLTLARMGLYTVNSSDEITLVARTASDTTLFASTNTIYTRSFNTTGGYPSTYDMVAGTRYAVGVICVGTTAPTYATATTLAHPVATLSPRLAGSVTSLTDLPTSGTSYSSFGGFIWARLS